MLEILIRHLKDNGFNDIIINVHHFAGQVIDFLKKNDNFGANLCLSDEKDLLLDTGGGLKKASWFFNDKQPFLVQNVDVFSDLSYREMLDFHIINASLATLAVCKRGTSRYFLFDEQMQLCGWENTKTGEVRIVRSTTQKPERFAFSGIHILDPAIFSLVEQEGKFSIVDAYLELASSCKITGFVHHASNWIDMGKPEDLVRAEVLLKKIKLFKE
jgi:NDP-sugar pyrophosphorylase family protein